MAKRCHSGCMTIKELHSKIKKLALRLYAFVPTRLPIGLTEFNEWASSVLSLYDFPDNDSTRWALASMVIHLGPTDAYKPKRYFGLSIRAGAAKQVAGTVFQELKLKDQAARAKAEQDKKSAEATATTPAASNVIPI